MNDVTLAHATRMPADTAIALAVVVPTFRERDNIVPLYDRLAAALAGVAWEVVFVDDDSSDGTADAVRSLARDHPRVRCLQRIGRRGLSSAVVEGCLATSAPVIVVIDADLQHDETILPDMLARLHAEAADIVIGTRYAPGGGIGDFTARRASISRLATRLSKLVVKTPVSDPMSGFFMMRRTLFEATVRQLSSDGFKILLDILSVAPPGTKIAEEPYIFRSRLHGESKFDQVATWDLGIFLLARLTGNRIPSRFLSFAIIGASGVATQMLVFLLGFSILGLSFPVAETIAVLVAMAGNYLLNNALTYHDRRNSGWGLLTGFATYAAVCGLGAIANVGVATQLFRSGHMWAPASLAGILIGTIWNYAASRRVTWAARKG